MRRENRNDSRPWFNDMIEDAAERSLAEQTSVASHSISMPQEMPVTAASTFE